MIWFVSKWTCWSRYGTAPREIAGHLQIIKRIDFTRPCCVRIGSPMHVVKHRIVPVLRHVVVREVQAETQICDLERLVHFEDGKL